MTGGRSSQPGRIRWELGFWVAEKESRLSLDGFVGFVVGDFQPAFAIEENPEYPGSGVWGDPLFCFDRTGAVVAEPDSTWGPLLVLGVSPSNGSGDWVGMFPSGGGGGVTEIRACPSPFNLAVLSTGEAHLVDVGSPGSGASVVQHSVTQVVAVGADLMLLTSYSDIVAIGVDGVAWKSPRLALDDLVVTNATADYIACSGITFAGDNSYIEVDTRTGEQTAGPRFPEPQTPEAAPVAPGRSGHPLTRFWKATSERWRAGR